ncbi:MAG: hydrogenase expression/formation protein HypE [Bacillales bacterium]|jgi:hydrogenase expression/formation protein HypE|nr:hydrogenase expression/formation protein HypE [Bacillales bacterium]
MEKFITMSHGDGGEQSHELIQAIFVEPFSSGNEAVFDAATMPWASSEVVMSTDSFVVKPLFFPGGNIGKLAVTGTLNDISVSGARPLYLTCGFIIEEGFPLEDLKKIVKSMRDEADKFGVKIVAGDTKVVEKGSADGMYINTTAVGMYRYKRPNPYEIQIGDSVLINGTIGDHGVALMTARGQLGISSNVESDCAVLTEMIDHLQAEIPSIRIMRDPTRGGLATSLVEIAEDFKCKIILKERNIPIRDDVHGACDIVGFDPLYMANEGKVIVICAHEDEEKALTIMKEFKIGQNATKIGGITELGIGQLLLETPLGAKRRLSRLAGVMLPRIC